MTERYESLKAAKADLDRAVTKVTAVVWTNDHDVLLALLGQIDKFKEVAVTEWQRSYAERPVENGDVGVHAAHCCKDHGCSYGNEKTCPVVTGQVAQEYPCEECEWV
jgi:hypothetical protein